MVPHFWLLVHLTLAATFLLVLTPLLALTPGNAKWHRRLGWSYVFVYTVLFLTGFELDSLRLGISWESVHPFARVVLRNCAPLLSAYLGIFLVWNPPGRLIQAARGAVTILSVAVGFGLVLYGAFAEFLRLPTELADRVEPLLGFQPAYFLLGTFLLLQCWNGWNSLGQGKGLRLALHRRQMAGTMFLGLISPMMFEFTELDPFQCHWHLLFFVTLAWCAYVLVRHPRPYHPLLFAALSSVIMGYTGYLVWLRLHPNLRGEFFGVRLMRVAEPQILPETSCHLGGSYPLLRKGPPSFFSLLRCQSSLRSKFQRNRAEPGRLPIKSVWGFGELLVPPKSAFPYVGVVTVFGGGAEDRIPEFQSQLESIGCQPWFRLRVSRYSNMIPGAKITLGLACPRVPLDRNVASFRNLSEWIAMNRKEDTLPILVHSGAPVEGVPHP